MEQGADPADSARAHTKHREFGKKICSCVCVASGFAERCTNGAGQLVDEGRIPRRAFLIHRVSQNQVIPIFASVEVAVARYACSLADQHRARQRLIGRISIYMGKQCARQLGHRPGASGVQ